MALPHAARNIIASHPESDHQPASPSTTPTTPRPRIDSLGADNGALVERLLDLAVRGLPAMYRPSTDELAFTRTAATSDPSGTSLQLRGTSLRYAAIVALGAHFLPEPAQRQMLHGRNAAELVEMLIGRLTETSNLGDAALVCWAAAQTGHPLLRSAIGQLSRLDRRDRPQYVVEAAWVVSALAAASGQVDVAEHLEYAAGRLLHSRAPGSPLFPHATEPGLLPWYRSHVACFADQVYPIQALARLHHHVGNGKALVAARECAVRICELQGTGGQWWWHYDARTSGLIEGYPVYTVHQHAMAPMALLDLAAAGGHDSTPAIERGLHWLADTPELGGGEHLILDEAALTWRKVYRGDPRKLVRAVHGLTTRAMAGVRLTAVERLYRPVAIDRECRPYELGWLLFTWLGGLDATRGQAGAASETPSSAAEMPS